MSRIFIYANTICEKRLLDSRKIHNYLSINGHEIMTKPEDAEIIILIVCAASNIDTEKALDKIKSFQKNYNAELIVGGCIPAIDSDKLAEIFNGRTIVTKDLNRHLDKIDNLFTENKVKFKDIEDANILDSNVIIADLYENIIPKSINKIVKNSKLIEKIKNRIEKFVVVNFFRQHSILYNPLLEKSFFIRISWGCPNNCSFCAIKKAVGSLHSKSLEKCLDEFKKGLSEGYKNFVITADDPGSYGLDIETNFPILLDKITSIPGDYKIIIRDFNPYWIVKYIDELEEMFKRKKITQIIIPIQSGSLRILKIMNRCSDVEKMKNAFQRIKQADSKIALINHYIIGFPTETQEEFIETLEFIKESDFDSGNIFTFSCKKNTTAEKIEPKISRDEINKRSKYTKEYLGKIGYHTMYIHGDCSEGVLFGKKLISLY